MKQIASGRLPALILIGLIGCGAPLGNPANGVKERWYQAQTGQSRSRPAFLGTYSYFGTGDGSIVARDQQSGAVAWATNIGTDPIEGANLVARNGVVVASAVHSTAGLDAQTGGLLWRYQAPMDTTNVVGSNVQPGTVIDSRLDADDQTIYIPAWGASVSAVDLRSGVTRWVWKPATFNSDTAQTGVFRSGSMSVRISGDTVFATAWHFLNRAGGSSEAWVIALDRITGRELWRARLPYVGSGVLIEAAPQIYKDLLLVHTLSGRTYAINRASGAIRWEHAAPDASLSTVAGPEVYKDVVYVDGGNRNLFALNASDGTVLWRSPFPSATSRDMLVTPRRVVFTNGGTLFIVNRVDGGGIVSLSQPRSADPLFASSPGYSNGFIFVSVSDAAWCFAEP